MTENKTRGAGRSRTWATVIYADSAPKDWLYQLDEMHIDAFVSPEHNKDVNPNGEPKKAHWHILINFATLKSKDQVKEVFDLIGGVGAERVSSFRNYARYLCHLDNPDKVKYNEDDVKTFGSLDYMDIIGIPSDKYEVIGEMMDFCEVNKIVSYAQLLRITRKYKKTWFRALCDNASWVMREYLISALWEREHPNASVDETDLIFPDEINLETGEVEKDE